MSVEAVKELKVANNSIWENVKTIGIALLIALVIRAFLFQPFNIPSGSMKSTLLEGDYLFVSKFAYGYSRHSLPFSPPVFDGRVLAGTPERGDVVVFKLPRDGKTDYIKRVIGLPGDKIQLRSGVTYINGVPVERERVEDFIEQDAYGNLARVPRYRETLANGVSYDTLDRYANGDYDNTQVYVVPEGHYFMMGDNRDQSADSREAHAVSYVPAENLVGRAEVLFFSTDGSAAFWEVWNWPGSIRWDRLFQSVQ
ncbi:MAG: signal peptidase I [Alphaproteobacteria bacterium]